MRYIIIRTNMNMTMFFCRMIMPRLLSELDMKKHVAPKIRRPAFKCAGINTI